MSTFCKIPFVLYGNASRQIAAVQHVATKDPKRGQITLPVISTMRRHEVRDLQRKHLDGSLSDYALYAEMESHLPRDQVHIEVSPTTKFRVLWHHSGPSFQIFHEPRIFPGMFLQNALTMVDPDRLCLQDKMLARASLAFSI